MYRSTGLLCPKQRPAPNPRSDLGKLSPIDDVISESLHVPLQRFANTRHRWTFEERAVLCVLYRWFVSADLVEEQTISPRDISKVFLEYLNEDPYYRGRPLRMSYQAVRSQLYEICAEGENSQAWCAVFSKPDFLDECGQWEATRKDLVAIAESIGINLVRRTADIAASILSGTGTLKKRLRNKPRPERSDTPESYMTWLEDESEIEIRTSSKRRRLQLITPPTSPESGRLSRLQKPELFSYHPATFHTPTRSDILRAKWAGLVGWRFFDDDSYGFNSPNGFLAGYFIHNKNHDLEFPDTQTELFQKTVYTHLLPEPKPSAWISVWKNMLPSLHRCLRSAKNANIAFIDLDYIGRCQQGLHHAQDAIAKTAMYGRELKSGYKYRYNGKGEFIVWREIKKEAILTTVSREALDSYLALHTDLQNILRLDSVRECDNARAWYKLISQDQAPLDSTTGEHIGNFLAFTGLPRSFLDVFAVKMACNWRLQQQNVDHGVELYLNGVRAGFAAYKMETGHNHTAQSRQESDEAADTFMERRKRIEFTLGNVGRGLA